MLYHRYGLETQTGLEPATPGLEGRCSAIELLRRVSPRFVTPRGWCGSPVRSIAMLPCEGGIGKVSL